MSEDPLEHSIKHGGPIAGSGMPDDAELFFREWWTSLEFQDARYHEKTALRSIGSPLALPQGFAVRFLENNDSELNVVLPAPATTASDYVSKTEVSPSLREVLQSRTARAPGWTLFKDDWNLTDSGTDFGLITIAPPG